MSSSLPFNSGNASIDKPFNGSLETEAIRSIFDNTEDYCTVDFMTNDPPNNYGFENLESSNDFVGEMVSDPGCKHVEFILQVLEERIRWSQKQEEEKKEFTRSGWRGRKLFLTLRPDQRLQARHLEHHIFQDEQIEHIRARFEKFNYTVKIFPSETRPDSYIIFFPGRTMAQKALGEAKAIGYKLVKKRPPRPSPTCPVMFKALNFLMVRRGKALSADVIDQIEKGDYVIVNQVKGRRARLVKTENGKVFNFGWVSVHTVDGVQLLQRCDKSSKEILLMLEKYRQPEREFIAVE